MSDHIMKAYDDDLSALQTMLSTMGGLAEEQLSRSLEALTRRDTKLADQVIFRPMKRSMKWNARLKKRQFSPLPAGSRWRRISVTSWWRSALPRTLKRIGDLAKNVAKRAHAISDPIPRRLTTGLQRMGQLALAQLKRVLDSFASVRRRTGDGSLAP